MILKSLGLCLFASLLCACIAKTEYASNDAQQYLKSKNGKDLLIPAPLTGENISDFYRLPEQTQSALVSISPPK